MEELIKDYNNSVCFLFYENEKKCEITIYNSEKVLWKNTVLEDEGKKILLDYCLYWRSFELISSFDTVCLENSNKKCSFVRFIEMVGVIKDETIDLFYNNSIIKFLCNCIETLQNESEKINIEVETEYRDRQFKPNFLIAGENKELMIFKLENERYFSYIISRYMKRHETIKVQEVKENDVRIVLDGIEFSIELLNEEQREPIMSKIRKEKTKAYKQFLESSFYQKLTQELDEQDSMRLVRTNDSGIEIVETRNVKNGKVNEKL